MNIISSIKRYRLLLIIILVIIGLVLWEALTVLSHNGQVTNFKIDKATGKQIE